MRIFRLYRKYLAFIGVAPLEPFQKNHSMAVVLKRLPLLILCVPWFICMVIFIGYEAKSIGEYVDAFFMCASLAVSNFIFVMFLWKMDILFKSIEDFGNLIEQRMENPVSKPKYVKLNENIEKWTGVLHFFIALTAPAVFMPNFIISFYLYFSTDLGSDAFSLPFPAWTPFDWRTPIGYLITSTIECSAAYYEAHIAACCIGTLISSCYIIFTFCDELKNEIQALIESSKAGEIPLVLMERVMNIVQFHAATKQLVFGVDSIFALMIVSLFLWSLSTICSSLLMIQMELGQSANPLLLIKPLYLGFWSFVFLFLICEFGQMLTNHFDQLNNAIDECDWTLFPKEIQKIWPTIIQNAQRPIILRTFKSASCSRESFKKVVNGGFSYFMIFREFQ